MFRKAERKKARLRLGICGPSGSGKTYSSLLIAHGLGGKIALLDTENGSGDLYAGQSYEINGETKKFEYDVAALSGNFSPENYINIIKEASKNYDVLIIDSLSHAWEGPGGVLDIKDKIAKASRSGNDFVAWREVTPKHNELVRAILESDVNVIVTLRSKTSYEIQKDSSGKNKPQKIGTKPIQREGMEYEFTTVLDLSVDGHVATSTKDRTSLFDNQYEVPSAEMGIKLSEWLNNGKSREDVVFDEMEKLEACDDLESLKSVFAKLWTDYKNNPAIQSSLKEGYDICKNVLSKKENESKPDQENIEDSSVEEEVKDSIDEESEIRYQLKICIEQIHSCSNFDRLKSCFAVAWGNFSDHPDMQQEIKAAYDNKKEELSNIE